MTMWTRTALAAVIDHTQLAIDASGADIGRACEETLAERCASVCIRPQWVALAAEALAGSGIPVTTVVGFHEGTASRASKIAEGVRAVEEGAGELDLVMNWRDLIAGDTDKVAAEIRAFRFAVPDAFFKVIIESAALSDEQIVLASRLCKDNGADMVKTSTGYHPAGGATVEAVRLIAATVPGMGIKASGGISTTQKALAVLEAGATRIGSRSTLDVLDGLAALEQEN